MKLKLETTLILDDLKNSEEYHEIYGFTPMPNEYRSSQGLMGIVEFPNWIIKKIPASKIKFIKHIRFDFDKEEDKISKNERRWF